MKPKASADHLQTVLDYGIDHRKRRVFLHGDVDGDTIAFAVRGMMLMDDASTEPITLVISSYGGSIDESFVLHDVMRALSAPVHTLALGFCMSAAPFLVASGEPGFRFASHNCDFMVHAPSMGVSGHLENVVATAEAVRARTERMDRLLARYTGRRYSFWSKFARTSADTYFDAQAALEWGLIDRLWD